MNRDGRAQAPQGEPVGRGGPFDLDDEPAYQRWRAWKLARVPASADGLLVAIADPISLDDAERVALQDRLRSCGMAIYAGPAGRRGAVVAKRIGEQLGLHRIDVNWLAQADGVSLLQVGGQSVERQDYIPYTDRPINWHTDGYYHEPSRRIGAMLLHCESPAARGGENELIDHELAYIRLRDLDPGHVRALSAPDAMGIPARSDDSTGATARAAVSGPVFSVVDGELHMRYTARTRSISWRDDPAVHAARESLAAIVRDAGPRYRIRLAPGMGIVCNNSLHRRDGFADSEAQRRCVYRIRYLDRVPGTGSAAAAGDELGEGLPGA